MSSAEVKPLPKRKTKIVATLGPASKSREVIAGLIEAGMDVARLNFSHGNHAEKTEVYHLVREEAKRLGKHVAIFQDLCGPKVRIGELEGGEIMLQDGAKIALRAYAKELGNLNVLYVEAFNPAQVIRPGDKALLADGRIELVAESVTEGAVECVVRAGGLLRSRSGISVPDSQLNLPALTEKDILDVRWAVEHKVDYIALSFVGNVKDVNLLRSELASVGSDILIISKIERAASLDHISEIVAASDCVMVARGDLGLELPLERVPSAQRLIIETSNFAGVPVITATQMLVSMVNEVRPTRAEVSDVHTAVRDGTDAVMLSEETAVGKHPIKVIKMLDAILQEAEKDSHNELLKNRLKSADGRRVADAVCYAACGASEKVGASAIIACSLSGATARLMAKYRPKQLLFAATSEKKTLTRLAPIWGIEPLYIEVAEDYSLEDEVTQAMVAVRDQYGIKPGSRVVVTAGLRAKKTGSTNVMQIREIPRTA